MGRGCKPLLSFSFCPHYLLVHRLTGATQLLQLGSLELSFVFCPTTKIVLTTGSFGRWELLVEKFGKDGNLNANLGFWVRVF
jgi:hypothetical protein